MWSSVHASVRYIPRGDQLAGYAHVLFNITTSELSEIELHGARNPRSSPQPILIRNFTLGIYYKARGK